MPLKQITMEKLIKWYMGICFRKRTMSVACQFIRSFVAVFFSFGLVGCNFLAPRYERPPFPISDSYSSEGSRLEVDAAAIGWRDYFSDEKLRSLIEQALQYNRDLRQAVLRVEEARALYRIQRTELLPMINTGADTIRSRTPGDLNITREPLTASQYQASVSSNAWEIDFWGRVRNLKDAAFQNYLATDAARRATVISLIAEVADSYLRFYELDERITLAKQAIASREESFRIFKRRFEEGAASRLDLTQVETLLKQAQSLEAQLEQERDVEEHFLTFLAGSSVKLPAVSDRLNEEALPRVRAGLPSDLLVNRPDIIAAEHQLRAANANIGAARAAFFPRVTLIGSAGTASAEFSGLFAPGSMAWSFGPKISMPIFDMGRTRSNLDLAEVRKNILVAQYEKTIQTAFREVSDALSAQQWLAEQIRIQQSNLTVQRERTRLAQFSYDNGAVTFLEVLDAQRDLLAAEQQVVQTRRALLSSRLRLYTALGGGEQNSHKMENPLSPSGK